MAKQKQSAELATNTRQPSNKRARNREAQAQAEAASKLAAAKRRKAKGLKYMTKEDHQILRGSH